MLRIILLAVIQLWLIQTTVGVVPQIQQLNVQCDRTGMKVNVNFDIPFNGIIFSKGHYSDANCRYVSPSSRRNTYSFFIPSAQCGTTQTDTRLDGRVGFKNIIIVQNDPEYQEVWDIARKISCDWVTRIDKYVTFAPFGVDMLGIKEIAFPGDTVDCWMDIQRGHGPFAPTIAGVVPIGDKLTIVIYIRDKDGSFDIHVKDCYAYDSPDYKNPNARAIQLTDVRGCPIKEKLVKGFYRTRDVRNSGATIIAYGVINAFKFPEAMDVFLACNVEVCKGGCENPCQPEVSMAGGDADVQQPIPSSGTDAQVPDTQEREVPQDEDDGEVATTTMRNDVETGEEDVSGGGSDSSSGGTDNSNGETDSSSGGTDSTSTDTDSTSGGTDGTSGGTDGTSGGTDGTSDGTDSTSGGTETTSGGTETEEEGTSSNGNGDSSNETDDANTETTSEASNGSTEAPSTEATSAADEEEEERRAAAASNPVRVAVKTRTKSSNLRRANLKSPSKARPKTDQKAVRKAALKAAPRAAPKPIPKKNAKIRASPANRKRKQIQQQTGRGRRAKRSIIITGPNGTFSEMAHSITVISPVEDFDEKELEIWQRVKEGDNKVCFSPVSLITSGIVLTTLAILFSVSLLLSYGRLRLRYGEKSFS